LHTSVDERALGPAVPGVADRIEEGLAVTLAAVTLAVLASRYVRYTGPGRVVRRIGSREMR
jgi:hypothetical protein